MTENKFEYVKKMILNNEQEHPKYKFKYITEIFYYSDTDEYFEEIWCLDIKFVVKNNENNFKLKIKFKDISDLKMNISGDDRISIEHFKIENKNNHGYENSRKYFVEDYEDDIVSFYCGNFEIKSFEEFK